MKKYLIPEMAIIYSSNMKRDPKYENNQKSYCIKTQERRKTYKRKAFPSWE